MKSDFIKFVKRIFYRIPALICIICVLPDVAMLQAQIYPIQVSTEITPPYSVYLSDYTSAGTNKLNVNLLLTDIGRFNYPVKLRLIIEGEGITISTSAAYIPEQIILDGGSPLRLSGDELAGYFNPRNLDFKGYSKEKFMQTGALPEGIYRIGFQVLDYNKSIAVSQTGAATAWLILNDPPIFNIPEKNVKILASEPQNIMFQWMPRHMGSPNSAFSAEYIFQIYEIWPEGRNPNEVVNSTQPLIEKTSPSTTMMYSNTTETPLIPGRQYAYRVQARDVEGRDLFRNHGYSEVQMFTYGDPCDVPMQIEVQATNAGKIIINWQGTAYNSAYYLQYREANNPNAEWFPKNTYVNTLTLENLKPQTKYEYQLRGVCGAVNSDFSETQTITTPAKKEPKVVCGLQDPANVITNHVPLTSLLPGDIITCGQFPTQVTKATGGSGKWTGEGFMRVPFMGVKVRVTFTNIGINEKFQVTSGRIVSVYNIDSPNVIRTGPPDKTVTTITPTVPVVPNQRDTIIVAVIDTIIKSPEGPDVQIVDKNGDITTIHRNADGSGIIVNAKGDTTAIPINEAVVVKDANGNTTVIDKDGNVVSNNPVAKSTPKSPIKVTFSASEKQTYGFDALKLPMVDEVGKYYPRENINGSIYIKAWKSVSASGSDNVMVNVSTPRNNTSLKTLKITDANGNQIPLHKTGNDSILQALVSTSGVDGSIELTATYADSDTSSQRYVAGKINVVGYDNGNASHNVVIISVNENKLSGSSESQLQATLNTIYSQACETFTVSAGPVLKYNYQTFDANPSDAVSYTSDMAVLIKALKDTLGSSFNSNSFYIFLLRNSTGDKTGIMPFNQNFGFIFVDKQSGSDLERNIAHEIGHGAFGLMHTFDTHGHQTELSRNTTDNLMDYNGGAHLYKFQWDQVHEPVLYKETDTGEGTTADDVASKIICGAANKPDNIKNLITALKTCSGIDDAVAKLSDASLNLNLCAEERKDIIKCIAKGIVVGTEDEQSIIRILKTTPLNQKADLIVLISKEPNLLANLHSSIDGDELTAYYKELIMLFRLSKSKQDWDNIAKTFDNIEAQQQKKPITEWAKQNIFFWLDVGLIDYLTEGRIIYHNEEITTNNRLKFDQYTSVLAMSLNELKGVDLAPFDVIRLHFLSENQQLGIPKGEYADIPAIALRFLIQKQFNRDSWTAVNTGLLIGTLGSGGVATLWGKVDCVLGLGAILEDNYHNQLTKTPEGQSVLTAWKVLNVALLGRLGYKVIVSVPTAWNSLAEAIANLRVKSPTLAKQVENEAKQAFSEYGVVDEVAVGSNNALKLLDDVVDEAELATITKDVKYLPGPQLPVKIGSTFDGGVYSNRKLLSNEKFYKYHGTNNRTGRKYAWFSNKKYSTELELRQKLAIRDDWGVQIELITEFDVPTGTWVSEGKAAAQGAGYPGQDYQAVILNTPNSWIIRTDKAFK